MGEKMKIRIEEIISLIIVIPYIVFITLYIQIKMAWDLIKYKQIEVSGK
jgi:hypothetical protein